MIRKILTLAILSAFAFGAAACSEEQRALHRAPGKYESESSSTNQYGTTTTRKKTTTVDQDEYGNKRAVVEDEETRDPEGLFNKRTVKKSKKAAEENVND